MIDQNLSKPSSVPDELFDNDRGRHFLGGIGNTKYYSLLKKDIKAVKIGRRTFVWRSELERYAATLPSYKSAGM